MPAYNFKKRFKADVKSGKKRQTIRKKRKRRTKAGDTLYLYCGLRQKGTELLRTEKCAAVHDVTIFLHSVRGGYYDGCVKVGPDYIRKHGIDEFARADGFTDAQDFFKFWVKEHDLSIETPMVGFELIQWEPTL